MPLSFYQNKHNYCNIINVAWWCSWVFFLLSLSHNVSMIQNTDTSKIWKHHAQVETSASLRLVHVRPPTLSLAKMITGHLGKTGSMVQKFTTKWQKLLCLVFAYELMSRKRQRKPSRNEMIHQKDVCVCGVFIKKKWLQNVLVCDCWPCGWSRWVQNHRPAKCADEICPVKAEEQLSPFLWKS